MLNVRWVCEGHQERLELRRHIIENNGLQTLFTGDQRRVKVYLKNLRNGSSKFD